MANCRDFGLKYGRFVAKGNFLYNFCTKSLLNISVITYRSQPRLSSYELLDGFK